MQKTRVIRVLLIAGAVLSSAALVVALLGMRNAASSSATRNRALLDSGATAAVIKRADAAMGVLWSYDYRRLKAGRLAASKLVTKEFEKQYASVFASINRLAPEVRAVVTATVTQSAVQQLQGDRAVVLVFLRQQATKQATGQVSRAGARLRVQMRLVNGDWKVAAVTPF